MTNTNKILEKLEIEYCTVTNRLSDDADDVTKLHFSIQKILVT